MTKQPTVVVLHGGTTPSATSEIERVAEVRYATGEQLAEALPGADVLFVWHFRSDAVRAAWPAADSLRWIHAASAGVDRLLFPELLDSEVVLTNSRGVFDRPMAEYVLGAVLSFAKDLHTSVRFQDREHWQHRETERIEGKKVLVVGTGPIGRAIAGLLGAAGMAVSGAGRVARSGDPDFGDVHASTELAGVLGDFDYVVLAAPLTEQTKGLIDADALARFKPTARLINVGRGELVVQDDLVRALQEQRLAGAALDVFETEPLPESSPLWEMPNVLVSPHMSGDTVGWTDELVHLFLSNLRGYAEGGQLRNVVDKQRGYVSGSERN
ncbi:phosphoglycerate dehydrogenase-like enzyme [Saccharopolyspora erythraea NRRL 2338]|uniref:D-isomer specific 2-hydroxyacid dehydrogenase n=2 Tax=Saccharopolyspora erythraea TaxID=1836 RepID=A4FG68_SACEN|nr:D-2-hydroxyacid dehydrogenase [Saccharopolyspora erythraea]EQD82320.1 2-hydroxyacid dehydrogenase [Saccharopolyspora erythraea D]PFG96748.1 phosphoglycerate dehydrogenase-like enzyme [Saccharopolyspora erythraea NRRL 2338]QRK86998.1 D-2-hydroxyacid dehydrogenase [Saccharopolyspora erythraea]CAM03043.1 putative D-isomer specific 2-hydroxyacid dehydrogenase [Saccharopolyspora erythraea NRRL 2338]